MKLRDFEPLDLYRIRLREGAATVPGWRDRGAEMLKCGPCWTAHQDGIVRACAGLVLHWPGRAGTWCIIGADMPTAAWPWLHKHVQRGLNDALHHLGLRRIEAECVLGWPPGTRWLQLLGFECEGPMRAYGHDGRDFLRYARIAEDAAA